MSYLERLKDMETRHRPTDKTDKTTFVSSVSSHPARIEHAISQDEREVLAWLHRIEEYDPVVIGETLAKCRVDAASMAFFLGCARGEDFGAAQ